ncbi:MAG TPA: phosphonate ABC transporter, permease protein PhnE [Planctomycetota bacterium]|nr:phosphonate ABC transporter, permease protein PhnE [Planctomycetota bacterium]
MTGATATWDEQVLEERTHALRRRRLGTAAVLLVVLGSLYYAGFFDAARYGRGIPAISRIIVKEGFPPDFRIRAEGFREWWSGERGFAAAVPWALPLWDTLLMSIGGTTLAVVLSFGLGFLAARNTTPHPAAYAAARGILNLLRAIPELVMGIIFLVAVGVSMPPILPGVLALGFHSIGMIGKFFAESIEHCDPAPLEAVRAVGGRGLQVIWHGVLPQTFPQMADVAFYRWEYNFRASVVMGMVGCGGLGLQIQAALAMMEYRQLTALLILVLITVTLVDATGAFLRKKLK